MSQKFKIKFLYDNDLTKPRQKECREKFMEKYDVTKCTFYLALTDDKITAERLKFFADYFDCPMEDLYCQVKTKTNGVTRKKARKYGLS